MNYLRKVSPTRRCWSWGSPCAAAQQRSFVTSPHHHPGVDTFFSMFGFYLGQRHVTVYKALGVFQGHPTRISSLHKLSRT